MYLFDVRRGNCHFITYAMNQQRARERAYDAWYGTGMLSGREWVEEIAKYEVTKLTNNDDRIHFDLTFSA